MSDRIQQYKCEVQGILHNMSLKTKYYRKHGQHMRDDQMMSTRMMATDVETYCSKLAGRWHAGVYQDHQDDGMLEYIPRSSGRWHAGVYQDHQEDGMLEYTKTIRKTACWRIPRSSGR